MNEMTGMKMILSESFKCLRNNATRILLLVLLISLPIALIQACVVDARFDVNGVMSVIEDAQAQMEAGEEFADAGALTDASSKLLTYLGITMLLSAFSLIVQIGVMLIVRNHRDGVVTEFRDVFEMALRLFPKVLLTQILAGVLMAIGFLFCVLPGVFMYYVFYMIPYGVVYTELWGRKGLFVSSLYSRKYGRKVLSMILINLLYTWLTSMLVQFLVGLLPHSAVMTAVSGTVAYCVQDLFSCVLVACFSTMALSMDLGVDLSQLGGKTRVVD